MQFFIKVKEKVHEKLLEYTVYVKFLQMRDKATKCILAALFAFFDLIGPFLSFLCTKKSDKDENQVNKGVM